MKQTERNNNTRQKASLCSASSVGCQRDAALNCCWAPAPAARCPQRAQQQTRRTPLLLSIDGHWHAPPRNWVHKKIPGCAIELNTQNCAWFGSQISLTTAMSFREAMPPEPPTRGSAPVPRGGTSVPQTLYAPTSKSWLRHCWWDRQTDGRLAVT